MLIGKAQPQEQLMLSWAVVQPPGQISYSSLFSAEHHQIWSFLSVDGIRVYTKVSAALNVAR